MQNIQVRVAIAGVDGRMGRQLAEVALQSNYVKIGAAFSCKKSLNLGIDVGELIGRNKIGVKIKSDPVEVIEDFDIFIDFTSPEGTLEHLKYCCKYGKGMVIGTTGFDEINKNFIKKASNNIPIVLASNFSIGINIMFKLLQKITTAIGNNTDIDIIEKHHRYKIDIPSGTALEMGEIIANTLGKNLQSCVMNNYTDFTGERIPGSISISSIRSGDIIGEHTVTFADIGESIKITHNVSNRVVFAKGAINAALWLKKKKLGIFNMCDVLNLSNF